MLTTINFKIKKKNNVVITIVLNKFPDIANNL